MSYLLKPLEHSGGTRTRTGRTRMKGASEAGSIMRLPSSIRRPERRCWKRRLSSTPSSRSEGRTSTSPPRRRLVVSQLRRNDKQERRSHRSTGASPVGEAGAKKGGQLPTRHQETAGPGNQLKLRKKLKPKNKSKLPNR